MPVACTGMCLQPTCTSGALHTPVAMWLDRLDRACCADWTAAPPAVQLASVLGQLQHWLVPSLVAELSVALTAELRLLSSQPACHLPANVSRLGVTVCSFLQGPARHLQTCSCMQLTHTCSMLQKKQGACKVPLHCDTPFHFWVLQSACHVERCTQDLLGLQPEGLLRQQLLQLWLQCAELSLLPPQQCHL